MSLENSNRLRVKELVALLPGIHLRELQRLLRASFNTTRYHVYNLERNGEVQCWREGGYSRLFPPGFDDRTRDFYSALHSKTTRRVLRALVLRGESANGEISTITGLPKSTVSEQLELLCATSVVTKSTRMGGVSLYDVKDREQVGGALALFEKNLLAVVSDSFADLWDF